MSEIHAPLMFPPALLSFIAGVKQQAKQAMDQVTFATRKARFAPPQMPSWRKCWMDQVKDPIKHIDYLA